MPQLSAIDKPYPDAAVLYIVNDSFTELVEGKMTGNKEANEEVIPPRINKVDR